MGNLPDGVVRAGAHTTNLIVDYKNSGGEKIRGVLCYDVVMDKPCKLVNNFIINYTQGGNK